MNSPPAPEPGSFALAVHPPGPGSSAGAAGAAPGHLRGIEGGYDLDRWPILVAPLEGELGESWLLRVAARYGLPPTQVVAEAGLGALAWRGRARRARAVEAVTERIGCGLPEARSAAAVVIAHWWEAEGRARVPLPSPRFCPCCLDDDDGVWMVEWANPLMVICPRHDVLLLRECPECGLVPFAADAWSTRIASGRLCPQQGSSSTRGVRRRYGWCDTDLSRAPVEEVSPVLRAAQEDVVAALRRAATMPAAAVRLPIGWTVTAAEYARAVLELLDEQLPRASWVEADGSDLALMMYVATEVLHASGAEALQLLRAHHGVLHPAGDHTPLRRRAAHLRRGNSPLLMSLMLTSIADGFGLADRLMFRTATRRPRFPGAPQSLAPGAPRVQGAWPARGWVPPWLWEGVLSEHVDGRGPYAPAVVSLALSKVGSSVPLRAIAADLNLPSWLADRARDVLRRSSPADLDAVTADLEACFERLAACPPPIDYSQRVDDGRDLGRVHAAAREAGQRQGQWTAEDTEAMSVLLWSVYTASHPRFYPRINAAAWRVPWPPDLDIGRFLADAYALLPHADGEPMTWHPYGAAPEGSWRSPVANCDAHGWDCPPRGCNRATAHLRYALDRLIWSGSCHEEKPQRLASGDWVPRGHGGRQRFNAEGERLRRILLVAATPWSVFDEGEGILSRNLAHSFAPARWHELMTDPRPARARPWRA